MNVLVVTVVHTPLDARIHRRQVTALLRAGHRVEYAAPFVGHGVDPHAVRASRLSTVDLPRAHGRHRFRAFRAARRLVRRSTADVVLIHDPELLLAVAGRGVPPVVWDVHEDLRASLADKPWLPRAARGVLERGIVRLEARAEGRHTLLLAEHGYQARFGREHLVVPNLPWLPPASVRLGDDRVVYIGRVSVRRGGRDLLAVAERLAPAGVQVEVIGPIDEELRSEFAAAAASGVVTAPGFVENARALERLEGALAGLSLLRDHPNYHHSMPTKVLEYQAHGLPVITTPLPEAVRAVEASGGGIVVPFSSPQHVVRTVLDLRKDPERARRLGAAGRTAAERSWSWDRMAPLFVSAVEDAARAATGQE